MQHPYLRANYLFLALNPCFFRADCKKYPSNVLSPTSHHWNQQHVKKCFPEFYNVHSWRVNMPWAWGCIWWPCRNHNIHKALHCNCTEYPINAMCLSLDHVTGCLCPAKRNESLPRSLFPSAQSTADLCTHVLWCTGMTHITQTAASPTLAANPA